MEIISVEYLVLGLGLEGCLKSAELSSQGFKVLNIGIREENYGGQHFTSSKGLDKCPLLLLSNGELSHQLVRLGSSDYISFRPVTSITVFPGKEGALKVPFRKEHVMLEPGISLGDKRRLMRLLEGAKDVDPIAVSNNAFEWLQSIGLSEEIIDLILYGCCYLPGRHVQSTYSVGELMRNLRHFYNSLPQPLLYPIYGASEIAQSLARISAVNGTIHMLNQPVIPGDHVQHDSQEIPIACSKRLDCLEKAKFTCQRVVFHSHKAVHSEDGIQLYIYCPTEKYEFSTYILQLDETTKCTHDGFLYHIWAFTLFNKDFTERMKEILPEHYTGLTFTTVDTCTQTFVY